MGGRWCPRPLSIPRFDPGMCMEKSISGTPLPPLVGLSGVAGLVERDSETNGENQKKKKKGLGFIGKVGHCEVMQM